MPLLMPDKMLNGILDLRVDLLRQWKIKGVLLDVDNTMTSHDNPEPLDGVLDWTKYITSSGIRIVIVSNNNKNRVSAFAGLFELPYISRGLKPLPFGFIRAKRLLGMKRKELLVVGDQVYTDVLGAHLAGFKALLLKPVKLETTRSFQIRRRMEKGVIRRYYRQKGNSN